ncbi:class I mannose-6-phosphate isomerase [Enterococcus asini]|uniref:class I mannose-6-phosphate isomerase n=1 Tax=Enterococcus asini TaxID=57732 RepID=UPI00288F96FB|nr:class I mannose-6-phosphate isomerase [Enterococcus asini]MDT2763724.1 class I mannose-6-phosphate isomerase [Enterococcus asini]
MVYRLRPNISIEEKIEVVQNYDEIVESLFEENRRVIAIETYPGIDVEPLLSVMKRRVPDIEIILTDDLFLPAQQIFSIIEPDLTNDPVFGRFSHRTFVEFLNYERVKVALKKTETDSRVCVIGVCASEIIDFDCLVYMDISRWELQLGYRKGADNWMAYKESEFSEKLKRAYYFEWPAGDELRREKLLRSDFYIDMNNEEIPKMVTTESLHKILYQFTKQPFRLVPYFDPGIWGGEWMQKKFKVGQEKHNLAWSFDGVPEENSILAKIGDIEFEMPAQILVDTFPESLLGKKVYGRFGKDFPIRFDFLDTMNGQNLSLQVHPTLDYAYRHFGAKYTQDESYYILDCEEDATVYLGLKNGVSKGDLVNALELAQISGKFTDEDFVNNFEVKKHDHILIPAGTVHSSGKNCVVLEISATPNRFTFKLWDWERVDLDGKPRPISIEHGKQVINEKFNTDFVETEFINDTQIVQTGEGYFEEHTGLHELEAIETRRLNFNVPIKQNTVESVNMLNLVEGDHIRIESPTRAFDPFDVYYGETFIISEEIQEYTLIPAGEDTEYKVMKAYIR